MAIKAQPAILTIKGTCGKISLFIEKGPWAPFFYGDNDYYGNIQAAKANYNKDYMRGKYAEKNCFMELRGVTGLFDSRRLHGG